jgi:DNA primase
MLSQETIQAVQQTALIEEVVGDFVSLKKRGQNLWACCPFHQERTPSFAVSPSKGFYKCFGCDAAGDAIAFVKAIEGISFVEAVKHLAQKYGIPIQETEDEQKDIAAQHEKDSLYILMKLAQDYYQEILWKSPEGQRIGYTYLREREITDEFMHQFGLGYSLDSWQGFHTYAQQQGYSDELLEKAGLIVHNQEKLYDRFRGRIIFPIHNLSGKVIAFAARILGPANNQPKYVNSPETPIYHKSDVLYGIYQAKQKIKQADHCYLVEGYTDVIALHMAGIENVVASSGTALTEGQIQLISRFTRHITVLFDGDTAGIQAALRGVDKILEQGLHVKVILLPPGEDPDSYAKKVGRAGLQDYIQAQAQDFITFKTKLLMQGVGEDLTRKAEIIKEILQSISLIPDAVNRSLFLQQTSKLLNIDQSVLLSEHNKLLTKRDKEHRRPNKLVNNPVKDLQLTAKRGELLPINWATTIEAYEQESIRLLLNYGAMPLDDGDPLSSYLLQELADVPFQHSVYKEILTIYEQHSQNGQIVNINIFIQHPNEKIQKTAIDLTASPYEVSENWQEIYQIHVPKEEDNLYRTIYKNILRLKLRLIHQLIEENSKLLKGNTDSEEEDKLLQVHAALKQSEVSIAQQLGMVIVG